MRDHELQIRERQRHILEQDWQRVLQWRLGRERGPLVDHDRQIVRLAELIHRHHTAVGRMDVLIDRPQLDAPQPELDAVLQRVANLVTRRVDGGKPDHLVRMLVLVVGDVLVRRHDP